MTLLFRTANVHDLEGIHHLAEVCGIGMTTLPKDINVLKKRLELACRSFYKTISQPSNEYYLFVLEDITNSRIIGTSAIEASLGTDCHFYSYKRSTHTQTCTSLNIQNDYEQLNLVTDNHGRSELCTLFLDPNFRHGGNGLLLSRSRFLFMSCFPERFQPTVIAEMRGASDENGQSPFWDAVGAHFFHMPFAEADRITSTNKEFITTLMPKDPIYINLLPKTAQAVIGKIHPQTVAALTILLKEGFHHTPYVDIFDAGPTIEANRETIQTIRNSQVKTVNEVIDSLAGDRYIISNTQPDFRATIGRVRMDEDDDFCTITRETAAVLAIKRGDKVRVVAM